MSIAELRFNCDTMFQQMLSICIFSVSNSTTEKFRLLNNLYCPTTGVHILVIRFHCTYVHVYNYSCLSSIVWIMTILSVTIHTMTLGSCVAIQQEPEGVVTVTAHAYQQYSLYRPLSLPHQLSSTAAAATYHVSTKNSQ